MRPALPFAFMAFPLVATAAPKVEECYLDIPAAEATIVMLYSDGADIRRMEVIAAGETGNFRMDVTPASDGDAMLHLRNYRYSRHIAEGEGEIEVTLAGEVRAIVLGGAICETDACFTGYGIERAEAQGFFDDYLRTFGSREGCQTLFGG